MSLKCSNYVLTGVNDTSDGFWHWSSRKHGLPTTGTGGKAAWVVTSESCKLSKNKNTKRPVFSINFCIIKH